MKTNQYFFRIFALVTEFILINLSCKLAYFLKYGEFDNYEEYYISFFIIFTLAWIGASLFNNSYDLSHLASLRSFLRNLFTTAFIHFFIILVYIVSIKAQYLSRYYLIYNYTATICSVIAFRSLLILAYRYYNNMTYFLRKIVLVGPEQAMADIYRFFSSKNTTIYRFLEDVSLRMPAEERHEAMREVMEELKTFCIREQVNELYVSLPLASEELIEELADFSDDHFIYFRLVTEFEVLRKKRANVDFLGHIPIISLRQEPLRNLLNQMLKRGFDLVFSLAVILLVFPVMFPLIALLIKLDSPGPVIFKQLRSGKNNRKFWCYKFRTMRVNPDEEHRQATRHDSRVTPLGRFLRRSSLDEFPQFINVLLGDMSVVGPRPHMIQHTHEYAVTINKFLFRHFITPGITGLAQVNGYRGEITDPYLMQKRVEYDTWYIENWSLLLDIKIVLQTILGLLRGQERAY
ncbi:MAG: undecaprenyl-phosphate glucose phosphotransferase [Bacteroidia bacterium]|nr:undecaprenyl-phosphate glucose phosphotransferase [Bacteroidia bacterium]